MPDTKNDALARQVSQSGPFHDGQDAVAAQEGQYIDPVAASRPTTSGSNAKQSTVQPFKTLR